MTNEKMVSSEESDEEEKPELEDFVDETNLDYVDTDYLLNETDVPETNVRNALERFVEDGPVAIQHFAEVLEGASDVWSEYLEKDEHNPRKVTEREANAYGAGAEPDILTNAPRYSKEVRASVEAYENSVKEELGDEYGAQTARRIASALLGAEERADAEMQIRED